MQISKKSWNVSEALAAGFFVIFLWLPLFQMSFSVFPKTGTSENRNLANKPELKQLSFKAISNYTKDFEKYFNDHYGFRNMLVRLNSIMHVKLLGMSPTERVILGKQGWLYYDDPNDGVSFKDYAGETNLKREELELIRHKIVSLNERLKEKNIYFMLVIVPNKHTVYQEYLPLPWSRMKSDITRIDQVCECLKDSGIDFVDLRAKMWSSKGSNPYPLYYRTDTHWNNLGAFFGYEEIIMHVKNKYPMVDPIKLSSFDLLSSNGSGGDLASFINMQGLMSDTEITLKPKTPPKALPVPVEYESLRGFASLGAQINDKRLPKLVMFRDSFSEALIPYLSENFSRSIYIWKSNIDFSVIDREKPDIVIFEVVERYLGSIETLTVAKSTKKG
jgi:hypothetical protein